jgi:hypothetical protein
LEIQSRGARVRAGITPHTAPNQALEPTPYSLRSFLASAFGRGSPPALGFVTNSYICSLHQGFLLSEYSEAMPRSRIERIRTSIRRRQYDMSAHAMEEMAEDRLNILDIEQAILQGQIIRIERDDPRGIKYIIEGLAADQWTPVGVVGRFTSRDRYLIITVYTITSSEE